MIAANLYGTPAKLDEIRDICDAHGAVFIEDAAESLSATYKGRQTGTFGQYNALAQALAQAKAQPEEVEASPEDEPEEKAGEDT